MKKYHTEDERKAAKLLRQKQWRIDHPGYDAAASSKYQQRHPERVKAAKKKRYEANPEPAKQQSKKWKQDNPEWVKQHILRNRSFIESIKIYYGCMNPGCMWDGPYTTEMLEFHHVDRAEKGFSVGATVGVQLPQFLRK